MAERVEGCEGGPRPIRLTPPLGGGLCHVKPCIRGFLYPVETLLELLSSGMSPDEVLADYGKYDSDNGLWCNRPAS
ncbi:MAG: DUF433 domain-containing protein [Isosphaeraceae bacterium]